MLYFISGESEKVSAKARELRSVLAKEGTHASTFDAEEFLEAPIEELLGGQGLFENARVIRLRDVTGHEEAKEKLLLFLEDMKASPNIFILEEEKTDAAMKKKIAALAKEKFLFAKEKEGEKEEKRFNRFALADALGRRDRKRAWVLLIRAFLEGAAPEELAGLLFWQVKTMLLARAHKNAQEAALKPFVFGKAQRFARNFTDGELDNLSRALMTLVHESRRGGLPLPLALERFVLSL